MHQGFVGSHMAWSARSASDPHAGRWRRGECAGVAAQRQYHLDKANAIEKRWRETACWSKAKRFGRKFGTGALEHARLEAQATDGHTHRPDLLKDLLAQSRVLLPGSVGKTGQATTQHPNGVGKTEAIGVDIGLQSGQMDQRADQKMNQQQAIYFLFHSLRRVAA